MAGSLIEEAQIFVHRNCDHAFAAERRIHTKGALAGSHQWHTFATFSFWVNGGDGGSKRTTDGKSSFILQGVPD
jgi:hypothetical protein